MHIFSADSHVVEPHDLWTSRMASGPFADRAPHMVEHDTKGHMFIVDGLRPQPIGLFGAAGKPSAELRYAGDRAEDLRQGGWDPVARLEDMDLDGVEAEVLYPSIAMSVMQVEDLDYELACVQAYNDWLIELCAAGSGRLAGLAMIPTFDVDVAVAEIRRAHEAGLRGVLLPGAPPSGHYAEERFDPMWAELAKRRLPASFHILTGGHSGDVTLGSGIKMMFFMGIVHAIQQTLSLMVFGGVFDRHPDLQIVSAEHDAGWVAHFIHRLDQKFERFSAPMKDSPIQRSPGEYLRKNVFYTFQDDPWAVVTREGPGVSQLMWASDYPHSDSTWPNSQKVIERDFGDIPREDATAIVGGNAARLYGLGSAG